MSDARRYAVWPDPKSRSRCHEPFKVGNPFIFNSYLLCYLHWELATDHWFLNYGAVSKFVRARFLIFVLVFVSCDIELGRNVSCEASTISLAWGWSISCCQYLYMYTKGHLEKMLEDKKVSEDTKAEIRALLPKVRCHHRLYSDYIWTTVFRGKFCQSPWRRPNSAARLEIPRLAENCGPYIWATMNATASCLLSGDWQWSLLFSIQALQPQLPNKSIWLIAALFVWLDYWYC